jgi:hypothetical protein
VSTSFVRILVAGLAGLAVPAAIALATSRPADGPLAPSLARFDFGVVPRGAAVAATFELQNVSSAPIAALQVAATSPFATLRLSTPRRVNVPIDLAHAGRAAVSLAPGERVTVAFLVDTASLPDGPFAATLTVEACELQGSALAIPIELAVLSPPPPGPLAPPRATPADPVGAAVDEPPTPAIPAVIPVDAPQLVVDSETITFGPALRGEVLRHTFELANRGASELVIEEVRNGCACTAASLVLADRTIAMAELAKAKPVARLAPGATAKLDVELETSRVPRTDDAKAFRKIVRLITNDPRRPEIPLVLSASVSLPYTLEPDSVDFGKLRKGATAHAVARLSSSKLGAFEVTATTSGFPASLRARATRAVVGEGAEPAWLLELDLLPNAPLGNMVTQVTLALDHAKVKQIDVPVHFTIEPNVDFVDNHPDGALLLDFETVAIGSAKTVELSIENRRDDVHYVLKSATLERCRPADAAFTAEIVEVVAGERYVVRVTAPASAKAGFFQGELILAADHPEVPRQRVPFRGWWKAQ